MTDDKDQKNQKRNLSLTDSCAVKFPLEVEVKDKSNRTWIVEMVLIGILVWTICVGGIYLIVRHVKVKGDYDVII